MRKFMINFYSLNLSISPQIYDGTFMVTPNYVCFCLKNDKVVKISILSLNRNVIFWLKLKF